MEWTRMSINQPVYCDPIRLFDPNLYDVMPSREMQLILNGGLRMIYRNWVSSCFIIIFLCTHLEARPQRPGQIPNGFTIGCANCHVNPAGDGARNAFGSAVESEFLSGSGASATVVWNSSLARLDSDGDGATNGEELQDSSGSWRSGQAAPGTASLMTNPGDASSTPAPTNVAPIFSALTNQTVKEGEELSFSVIATDADGDSLTYSASDLPEGADFKDNTFTWTPGFAAAELSYQIIFSVTDGEETDAVTLGITVENVDQPAAIDAFKPSRLVVLGASGSVLTFSVTANDPDNDPLNYLWNVNGTARTETTASIDVTVSDGESDDRVSVTVSSGGSPAVQTWIVGKMLKGDFDGNGNVSLSDFISFVRVFGTRTGDPTFESKYDLSGNGSVDLGDFIEFVKYFGLP